MYGPVFTGKESGGPPPNWNAARAIRSLPLRGFSPNHLPEGEYRGVQFALYEVYLLMYRCTGLAECLPDYPPPPQTPTPVGLGITYQGLPYPLPPHLHLLPPHLLPPHSAAPPHHEEPSSSEISPEHVMSTKGLARELRKIWPDGLPWDLKEISSVLDAALKSSTAPASSPPSATDLHVEERAAGDRPEPAEKRRSTPQLRKASPVEDLRSSYKNAEMNGHGYDALGYPVPHVDSPIPDLAALDLGETLSPVEAEIPTVTRYTFPIPKTPDADINQTTHHATAQPADRTARDAKRQVKASRYLQHVADYMRNQEDVPRDHDRALGQIVRANVGLQDQNAMYEELLMAKDEQLQKMGQQLTATHHNIAYLDKVACNLASENQQLKHQLQSHGIKYKITG